MKMEMKMTENDQWEMPDTVHHSSIHMHVGCLYINAWLESSTPLTQQLKHLNNCIKIL